MRILLIIILTFFCLNLNGQSNARFVFFDACNNEVLELPYELWTGNDSTIRVKAGETIELQPNYYQLHLQMTWNEKLTGFHFDIITNDENRIDTLYLQQARFYGPTHLHAPPEKFKHYCCKELCNGTVKEVDPNGVTRFKGRFRNGIPISNLKYYNKSGELIRTEVYRKGNLQRIK